MKNKLYLFAVILSALIAFGFVCSCVGTFHADNVDWKVEKRENNQ